MLFFCGSVYFGQQVQKNCVYLFIFFFQSRSLAEPRLRNPAIRRHKLCCARAHTHTHTHTHTHKYIYIYIYIYATCRRTYCTFVVKSAWDRARLTSTYPRLVWFTGIYRASVQRNWGGWVSVCLLFQFARFYLEHHVRNRSDLKCTYFVSLSLGCSSRNNSSFLFYTPRE
jgi:hypothetical protein